MNTRTQLESDTGWLAEHSMEISREYAGKWIAVYEGRIVGVGATAVEASNQARKVCPDESFILEAVEGDADVIYGIL